MRSERLSRPRSRLWAVCPGSRPAPGDLYGQHLSVALVDFLRDEARFDSVDALIDQIARDAEDARAILAGA